MNNDIRVQCDSALAESKSQGTNKKSDQNIRKKVAFQVMDEIINDALESYSESSDTSSIKEFIESDTASFRTENEIITSNRPRRKFSLLRERFEPKLNEKIVYDESPTLQIDFPKASRLNTLKLSSTVDIDESDTLDFFPNYDKENLMTKSVPTLESKGQPDNLKEKRSVFLKQVLSPPRFQGWGKKRTFSPNAKIISKAH